MKIDDSFPTVFWGKDKSTKAQFCPCEEIFDSSPVTSCMVCVVHENKILLAKPPRGWGLPGGRMELGKRQKIVRGARCMRKHPLN